MSRLRRYALLLLLLTGVRGLPAAPTADQLLQQGYDHFYSLEYDQAQRDFEQLRRLEPAAPAVWNHIAQVMLYREMYRVGALESQLYGHGDPFLQEKLPPPSSQAEHDFEYYNGRALSLAQAAVAAHPNDAHARYDLAAAWALRGTYDFVLQRSYFAALKDALKARKQADQAHKLDPQFVDPLLIIGAQNYIAGSLPWTVKVMASLTGYSGNKRQGIAQIQTVAQYGEHGRTDALILLAVIDRRDGWNRQVIPVLHRLKMMYPRNVLFAMEEAEATEAAGLHDAALQEYQEILQKARGRVPGYQQAPLDKAWYDIGNIHRLFTRYPQALAAYRQAMAAPRAQLRYRQAASLAAAQVLDLMGQRQQAMAEYNQCIALHPDSPAARAARRGLKKPYRKPADK